MIGLWWRRLRDCPVCAARFVQNWIIDSAAERERANGRSHSYCPPCMLSTFTRAHNHGANKVRRLHTHTHTKLLSVHTHTHSQRHVAGRACFDEHVACKQGRHTDCIRLIRPSAVILRRLEPSASRRHRSSRTRQRLPFNINACVCVRIICNLRHSISANPMANGWANVPATHSAREFRAGGHSVQAVRTNAEAAASGVRDRCDKVAAVLRAGLSTVRRASGWPGGQIRTAHSDAAAIVWPESASHRNREAKPSETVAAGMRSHRTLQL